MSYSIDDFEYGLSSVSEKIDDLTDQMNKSRNKKEKSQIASEIKELITLYESTAKRKIYNKL